jgi:hypothetical protein
MTKTSKKVKESQEVKGDHKESRDIGEWREDEGEDEVEDEVEDGYDSGMKRREDKGRMKTRKEDNESQG